MALGLVLQLSEDRLVLLNSTFVFLNLTFLFSNRTFLFLNLVFEFHHLRLGLLELLGLLLKHLLQRRDEGRLLRSQHAISRILGVRVTRPEGDQLLVDLRGWNVGPKASENQKTKDKERKRKKREREAWRRKR